MNNSNTFKQKKEKYYSFIYKNGDDESSNIIFIGKIEFDSHNRNFTNSILGFSLHLIFKSGLGLFLY